MAGEKEAAVEGEMMSKLPEIERDPKTFFVERIREQARREALPLSPEETDYLELARAGKDEEAEQVLKRLKKQGRFKELDEHLTGLMNRAYDMDVASSAEGREIYRRAISALAAVDSWPHLSMFISQIVFADRLREGTRRD